jgi:hypothetical protein
LASLALTVAVNVRSSGTGMVSDASVERAIQRVTAAGSESADPAVEKVLKEATIQTTEQGGSVSEQAAAELNRLSAEPMSVLARAGYLDLKGDVWSCTVTGDGWVEVVVLSEGGEGRCKRQSIRMERDRWESVMGDGA